ncbi:Anaerobic nitric oxide reductase transcription regulator NorR [subsurface metagenome]
MKENRFRDDLYYRLSVFPIKIPSLRERTEDVPLLVDYILRKLRSKKTVSVEANEKLQNYNWPGNIRSACLAFFIPFAISAACAASFEAITPSLTSSTLGRPRCSDGVT